MEFEHIKLEIIDHAAVITLNQPDRLNACSPDMADEIYKALDFLEDARVLVLTGEGRAFCSGADLQARSDSGLTGGNMSFMSLNRHYNPLMLKLSKLDVPTISAVNGLAAGIGCSIALSSDFAIARKSAYFLQAFVNIGLVPDGGASWMLPRLLGKARALEMMMLGDKIPAEKAEDWGLIYKCVEDDAFEGEVKALATRLANGPTIALSVMRQNVAKALECDYGTALFTEAEGQRIAGDSADAMEGGMAFLQKRKAEFKGK